MWLVGHAAICGIVNAELWLQGFVRVALYQLDEILMLPLVSNSVVAVAIHRFLNRCSELYFRCRS